MNPRVAKYVSRGLLIAGALMVLASVPLTFAVTKRAEPKRIVFVNIPNPPDIAAIQRDLVCPHEGSAEVAQGIIEDLLCRIQRGDDLLPDLNFGELTIEAIALLWIATGALIVSRQPRNTAGWIFCAIGIALPLLSFCTALVTYGTKVSPVPGLGVAAIVGEYILLLIVLIPVLFLLFPDGRPPSRRWAWAMYALFGGLALAAGTYIVQPGPLNNFVDHGVLYGNPIGLRPLGGTFGTVLIAVGWVTALGASLATVVAVRQRYRRAIGEERQQMRWIVAVATIAGALLLTIVALSLLSLPMPDGGIRKAMEFVAFGIFWILVALTLFVGIPSAYLIAIYRYGLWDLDVVIRKARVALVLTLVIVIPTVLVVALASQVLIWGIGTDALRPLIGGVIIGLLLLPLVRWERKLARRITYGKRASQYEVLSSFSARMGEAYSDEDVLPRMAAVLGEGTGADRATVWLRVQSEMRPAAVWPHDASPPAVIPDDAVEVAHQGEALGALSVEMPASDPMNPAKQKLIGDLAAQAGLVLRNVRLIEELRGSRRRLVTAQDEERRRIERNIHDGAQQQLVALQVKQRLVSSLMGKDEERARLMLDELQTETAQALDDLRDLARGIYPPLLADQGLTAAIEAQARKSPVPVIVEPDGVGRYPQEVESAVYFSVLEAMQNVAKYANASRTVVRLRDTGELEFEVEDDGSGFDPDATARGSGLQGMADRLDAVGGSLEITSTIGEGTRVSGSLPLV
jgi:signal transduction histidine kinase